jgi:lipoprotein-anchoring transpeptidase ErfK/SrfK
MNRIHIPARAGIAALLLAIAGPAAAQGFSSASSLPPAQRPVPPAASPTELVPAAVTAPAVPGVSPAFASVSSPGTSGPLSTPGAGPALPPGVPAVSATGVPVAERIVIEKHKRRLLLIDGGKVVATYPVKLGLSPVGHKQYEGDFRTPEGSYFLSRRNPRSEYFLSLEVSYPSAEDRERARQAGMRPGGLIMIHGQPNVRTRPPEYYAKTDWTNGCIAVSNSDMIDLWLRTRIGMPIEIRP